MRLAWNAFLWILASAIAWRVDPDQGWQFWFTFVCLWAFNILGFAEAHFRKD